MAAIAPGGGADGGAGGGAGGGRARGAAPAASHVGAALLALTALCACEPAYPGEPVGTYAIVATLEGHGCGVTAVPVRDRLSYEVEIRRDRGIGYWRRPGEPIVSGLCDGRAFSFGASVLVPVLQPDPDTGYAGCTLEQRQTVSGTLVPTVRPDGSAPDAEIADGAPAQRDGATDDGGAGTDAGVAGDAGVPADTGPDAGRADAGAPPRVLEGTDEIVFAPTEGSDCTPLLAAAGGPWATLPCTIRYRVEGTDARAP